jgi:hypothetical protein
MARTKVTTPKVDAPVKLPPLKIEKFSFWIIGDTPLISHAWSEKARREMLNKQQKEVSEGREIRDPEADFLSSLYDMGDGKFGFPVTALKNSILSTAHKDRGVPRATVRAALWINHKMISTRPALSGAICDMPLIQIWGSEPEMREDMVRVGAGLSKTASLSYRAQFTRWAFKISGRLDTAACPLAWIPFLIRKAGMSTGIGDWRNEKNGIFGAFHIATVKEAREWDRFAAGEGPLPEIVEFGDDDQEVVAA